MNKNRCSFFTVILFLVVMLGLPSTSGATTKNKLIYTNRDAYINDFYPSDNYGFTASLWIDDDDYRAFIYFDLLSKPSNITKMEVVLTFSYINEPSTITIYTANSNSWEESSITWNSAPSYSTIVYTEVIEENGRFSFELPLASHQWNEITLVVKSSDSLFDTITSKDSSFIFDQEDVPHIKYTYRVTTPSTIPGYNLLILLSLLGLFSLVIIRKYRTSE